MDEQTTEKNEKTKNPQKKRRMKKPFPLKTVIALVMLTAIIVAVAITVSSLDGGVLPGMFAGDTADFPYNATGATALACVGDSLASLSPLELNVYDRAGETAFTVYCGVETPNVVSAGDYGAAYGIGGGWLCFFTEKGEIMTKSDFGPIVSASVNEKGYLAVCTEDTGYRGAVEIFDKNGNAVYRWHSGEGYVLTAKVGNNDFAAVVLTEGGSRIVRYALNREDELASWDYAELVLDIFRSGTNTIAVTQSGLIFLNSGLEETAQYDLDGEYLERFGRGAGHTVLLTGEHQLAAERRLVMVSDTGEELSSVPADGTVLALDAAGNYTAVLYQDKAVLYGKTFDLSSEKDGVAGAQTINVTAGGKVYTAGLYSANCFTLKPVKQAAEPKGGT